MTGWIILIAVVALLFLLSLVRLGGRAMYGADGFVAYVLAGPLKIQLFPAKEKHESQKPKAKKEKKQKEEPAEKQEPADPSKPGTVSRILQLLPTVAEAAGALKRKICINHLVLTVIWGAEDAASAALGYGRANALLGMIWPLIDNNFRVKKCDWNIDVDYNRSAPEFTADAAITITVGQLVSYVIHYGIKLLLNWRRSGKSSGKEQEA